MFPVGPAFFENAGMISAADGEFVSRTHVSLSLLSYDLSQLIRQLISQSEEVFTVLSLLIRKGCTHVLFLLVECTLSCQRGFPPLSDIDFKCSRGAFKVPECLVSKNDGFLNNVVQEHLIV